MKEINYAIVGFGGIAKTHAVGTYSANLCLGINYSINLKNIVSRKPLNYKVPGTVNTTCLEEVLKDPDIDFIDICTPNNSHKEIINKVLEYGKAVYCEKPLAASYKEALEVTKAVENKGVKNAVALIYRVVPSIRLIKEVLQEKIIGDIIDFKIKLYHKSYLDENKKGSWRTDVNSGGGALMDLGVHLVDIIHFTLGTIETVDAQTRIFFKDRTNVDEIANCNFTLGNGVQGNLEVSRIFADLEEPTTFIIYGSKGSITMSSDKPYTIEIYNYDKNSMETISAKNRKHILENYPSERNSFGFHQDSHMASSVNFASEILFNTNNSVIPTFKDALKAQRVIEAAYMSSKTHEKVNIKDVK